MGAKLGDAYLAIVPGLDKAAMSSAVAGVKAGLGNAADSAEKSLAGVASTAAKTAAAGAAACVAAGVAVTKSALDAYSAYEQNVGGIQKLFGNMGKSVEEYAALTGQSADECAEKWQALEDSQSKVISNASAAWKTAGLSANAYMENVTSFSAALIKSLGNDTGKAADYANMAMVDMSDNANTFGTSVQDIQNAYQGFAKQNFTMLDNLKLGYGGTQSEMKRLVSDASKMTDVQEKLGVTVDKSSLSFSNVVAAIHVMQESMQVGGTTAREAATTIEGSVNAMKAAWGNWLAGLGDDSADMKSLTSDLADSVVTAASNIVPRVGEIASTLVSQVPATVASLGPSLVSSLADVAESAVGVVKSTLPPGIADAVSSVEQSIDSLFHLWDMGATPIESFSLTAQYALNKLAESAPLIGGAFFSALDLAVSAVGELTPVLADKGAQLVMMLGDGIGEAAPQVVEAASGLMGQLASYFSENGGQLIESGLSMLEQLSEGLRENFGVVVDAVLELAVGMAQGLADGIPSIIEHVPEIVDNIAGFINDNAPKVLEAAGQIILALGEGLIMAVPTLIENIPQIIQAVVDVWSAFSWLDLGSRAVQAISSGISSLVGLVGQAGSSLVNAAVGVVQSLPSTLMSLGSQAVQFLGSGISGMVGTVISAAASVGSSIISALSGIPGQVVSIGSNIIEGIAGGISSAAGSVVGAITGVVGNAIDAAKNLLGIHSPSRVFKAIGRYTMAGMAEGVEGGERAVVGSVRDAMAAVASAAAFELPAPALPSLALSRAAVSEGEAAWRPAGSADDVPALLRRIASAVEQRGELAVYVDGKKLARSLARPMNQQLGVLAARGM